MRNLAQRLRGRSYLVDGAVMADQLSPDDRWVAPGDESVWHLVIVAPSGPTATLWYAEHAPQQMTDMHSYHPSTADSLRAVLARAAQEGISVSEMGGWVATSDRANLLILLFALAVHRTLPPSLAPLIITARHDASRMLVMHGLADRCGATPYLDDRFGCEMELLVADSRTRATQHEDNITALQRQLPSFVCLEAA
jgi:hypothetical protein